MNMCVESVEERENSTIFSIKICSPYLPPYYYQIELPHFLDKFSSALPSLPTTPLANNVDRVTRQDFEVPGWGHLAFLINHWPDGSTTTDRKSVV